MLKSNDKNMPQKAETIIGPTINVKGDFVGEGDIIVNGTLEGSLKTNAYVYIGDKAIVKAAVKAENGRLGGDVTGNITINNHLDIVSSAKISGDIKCKTISIEAGATFNGKCNMSNEDLSIKE